MVNLARRSAAEETMDSAALDPAEYADCLTDLARVNVITLTHRATLRWLRRATRDLPPGTVISILDVACGHGDLLRAIHRWAERRGIAARLEGIDLNPRSAEVARAATPPEAAIVWRTGDVFAYAPDPAPDFIVSSQFTHHLDDADVVRFLKWLDHHAVRGWFIADLQRNIVAYWGFQVLATLARWHRIVRQDGAISVARSFRKPDWQALLRQAGITATISLAIPFRLCVGRLK